MPSPLPLLLSQMLHAVELHAVDREGNLDVNLSIPEHRRAPAYHGTESIAGSFVQQGVVRCKSCAQLSKEARRRMHCTQASHCTASLSDPAQSAGANSSAFASASMSGFSYPEAGKSSDHGGQVVSEAVRAVCFDHAMAGGPIVAGGRSLDKCPSSILENAIMACPRCMQRTV